VRLHAHWFSLNDLCDGAESLGYVGAIKELHDTLRGTPYITE